MSLNVTVATPSFIACATDRRLTSKQGIVSERSMKLVQFFCKNARGIITYNGMGQDRNGQTPSDWLYDIQALENLDLMGLANEIRKILDDRATKFSADFGGSPRHTFVLSAFEGDLPVVGMISNYENIDGSAALPQTRETSTVELLAAKTPTSYVGIMTGATNIVRSRSRNALGDALKARRPRGDILRLMKKAIRDTSYVARIRGSVGSSVAFSYADRNEGFVCGTDVVGGSEIFEMPGMISPDMSIKDSWMASGVDFDRHSKLSGKRKGLIEQRCEACNAPVPAGYLICGACDKPAKRYGKDV